MNLFSRRTRSLAKPRRQLSIAAAVSVIAAFVPGALLLSAVPASATFTQSGFVSFTLEGCRNDGSITLPNGSGKFICPDAAYTTGNLGKGWNELDLVPHRLTTSLGSQGGATTDYDVYIAADNVTSGKTGYDVISVPTVGANSDASCSVSAGPQSTLGDSGSPFGGGTDTVMYRQLTIHQNTGTTCHFDYYQRLSLGSHLYSGSSLQSYMFEQSGLTGSKKTISIPVNEIAPQQLKKDSAATQDSSWTWNITKQAEPASIDFGNTCAAATSSSHSVTITVSWQRLTQNPDGSINIVTNVYARNPASRAISVKATDTIYSDPTALSVADQGTWPGGPAAGAVTVSTASTDGNPHAMSAFVSVPANTASQLLFTTNIAVAANTVNLYDVATAQYQDDVTGIPVPGISSIRYPFLPSLGNQQPSGTSDLTGSGGYLSIGAGTTKNSTATITDTEHLTGSAFTYSVDSVTPDVGSFTSPAGYTKTTHTSSDVTWTLTGQTGSGSVAFGKTVYVNGPVNATGTLSDSATLVGSDGFTPPDTVDTPYPATASVDLTSSATGTLDVSKTTSLTLDQATDFVFHLFDAATSTTLNKSMTVTMPAGRNGDGTPVSDTPPTATTPISGLDVTKHYYLNEDASAPYAAQRVPALLASPNYIAFNLVAGDLSSCTVTVAVQNNADPATAQVKKVTLPTSSGTWEFTLKDNGTVIETLTGATGVIANSSSYTQFLSALDQDGHTYTITETQQTDYDLTSIIGDVNSVSGRVTTNTTSKTCSFTLDLTTDSGHTFECTFTNTQEGTIIVKKVTNPTGSTDNFTFTGDAAGSISDGGTITVNHLVPGTYTSTEANPTPAYDLTSVVCDDSASATASSGSTSTRTATFKLDPGETVTCTFTNTQRGKAKVVKTVDGAAPSGTQSFAFQLRSGASATQAGTILESGTANAANGGVINFTTLLVPGNTYQLCETLMPGWDNNFATQFTLAYPPEGDNSILCTDFTVSAGETKTFNVDNHARGGLARTIGFWKNWASCKTSGGNQAPILDQTLAASEPTGILIGTLTLHGSTATPNVAPGCAAAVALLNKSRVDNGKKMASDPVFNNAAQLLAYYLNITAGAADNSAANAAAAASQVILAAVSFNGSTHTNLTKQQAADLNTYANTLDLYNNNLL